MTPEPNAPGGPPRPTEPRDPGDAWVIAEDGTRYWGRFGAAGLLAIDAERGVLLQHRVGWSHFGGTWALPGGARHEGESAIDGALREATEEAGVPVSSVRVRATSVLDVGIWTYTTVIADVIASFEPTISDPESLELTWVPVDEVAGYPLHPGFAAAWPDLRAALAAHPVIVVDVANVVGSVPDGWWKDRAGAASRFLNDVSGLSSTGVSADTLELAANSWFPRWVGVVEGEARRIDDVEGIDVVRAAASGDDAIVDETIRRITAGHDVTVVTSDRGLADRVTDAGAAVRGTGWLRDLI